MSTHWLAELGIPVLVVRGFGSPSFVNVVPARTTTNPRPPVLPYCGALPYIR